MAGHFLSFYQALLICAFIFHFPSTILAQTPNNKTVRPQVDVQVTSSNKSIYQPLFPKHSFTTPVFVDIEQLNSNASHKSQPSLRGRAVASLPAGSCAPGTPCTNGACCSNTGFCGYGPSYCGTTICISNCNATAECGQYGTVGSQTCPLNVCCSQYGFCGTTSAFCGTGCQAAFGGCGLTATPPASIGGSMMRTIGYYESWSLTRPCSGVSPEAIDVAGLTHLNFAFAFFDPTSFQIQAMDANAQSLLTRFTNIKSRASGLQTWISIGGWSFNDPGNSPDTRTAFSNMASTSANRRLFINSLISFMTTYGFDGADIDWEYPAASDRGGIPADTANFVLLVKEMKASFGSRFGLSVTIPTSYWYLRHFDVNAMQASVDWFNFMTYDLHGTWDSSNVFTGPYVLPHTNLTEIDLGMQLLWRAGVSPSKVVMGLGWYGRSFTLSNPLCNTPNGVCQFSAGANAGTCSGTPGILMNTEIQAIIQQYSLTVHTDTVAAVNWITWNSNQWVSYDNNVTYQLKRNYANKLGLGGLMVWAIDQQSQDATGLNNFQPFGTPLTANQTAAADGLTADISAQNSCYVSDCNPEAICYPGYTPTAQMNGSVAILGTLPRCGAGSVRTVCCAAGSVSGTCTWRGWRGQGLSCVGGCNSDETSVAQGTNSYFYRPAEQYLRDLTCNGGIQNLCCSGYKTSTSMLVQRMAGPPSVVKNKPGLSGGQTGTILSICTAAIMAFFAPLMAAELLIPIAGWIAVAIEAGLIPGIIALCVAAIAAGIAAQVGWLGHTTTIGPTQGGPLVTSMPNPYTLATYSKGAKCQVTYTCVYGVGFDQVCDNQRYGLEQLLIAPATSVFHYPAPNRNGRWKAQWGPQHHPNYRPWPANGYLGRTWCEAEEFPMDSLAEAGSRQVVRQVDGWENALQGADWRRFIIASVTPCMLAMKVKVLPVTWKIGPLPSTGNRGNLNGFIRKYGFDSTYAHQCFPTMTRTGVVTTISDQGFRIHSSDPMFTRQGFTRQDYSANPNNRQSGFPVSINSAAFMKRDDEAVDYDTTFDDLNYYVCYDGHDYYPCTGEEYYAADRPDGPTLVVADTVPTVEATANLVTTEAKPVVVVTSVERPVETAAL